MFGLVKTYSVHMCSEVEGAVTLHGEPVENAIIKRSLKFAHKVEKEDVVTTDSTGAFYLPAVVIDSKIPGDMFSHEVTLQLITVEHKGETFELWNSKLAGISEPIEYKQKLLSLNGDLTTPKVNFAFPNYADENLEFCASSICRWQNDFEIYETDDGIDLFKDF